MDLTQPLSEPYSLFPGLILLQIHYLPNSRNLRLLKPCLDSFPRLPFSKNDHSIIDDTLTNELSQFIPD